MVKRISASAEKPNFHLHQCFQASLHLSTSTLELIVWKCEGRGSESSESHLFAKIPAVTYSLSCNQEVVNNTYNTLSDLRPLNAWTGIHRNLL